MVKTTMKRAWNTPECWILNKRTSEETKSKGYRKLKGKIAFQTIGNQGSSWYGVDGNRYEDSEQVERKKVIPKKQGLLRNTNKLEKIIEEQRMVRNGVYFDIFFITFLIIPL